MTAPRQVSAAQVRYGEAELEARVEQARRTGAHVWIAAAAFRVSEEHVRGVLAGKVDASPMLDAENVASISLGCYACEEPLSARLLTRRCRPTS